MKKDDKLTDVVIALNSLRLDVKSLDRSVDDLVNKSIRAHAAMPTSLMLWCIGIAGLGIGAAIGLLLGVN